MKAVHFKLFGKHIVIRFPFLAPQSQQPDWHEESSDNAQPINIRAWLPSCLVEFAEEAVANTFQSVFSRALPLVDRERKIVLERKDQDENAHDDLNFELGRSPMVVSFQRSSSDKKQSQNTKDMAKEFHVS